MKKQCSDCGISLGNPFIKVARFTNVPIKKYSSITGEKIIYTITKSKGIGYLCEKCWKQVKG